MSIDPVPIKAKYKRFIPKTSHVLKKRNKKKEQKKARERFRLTFHAYVNFFYYIWPVPRNDKMTKHTTISRENMQVEWNTGL